MDWDKLRADIEKILETHLADPKAKLKRLSHINCLLGVIRKHITLPPEITAALEAGFEDWQGKSFRDQNEAWQIGADMHKKYARG